MSKILELRWEIFSQLPYRKILMLFVLLFIAAAISLTIFLQHQLAAGITLPSDGQGIYESCVVSEPNCVNHLNTFATGGFKLVMNYAQMYASASAQLNYAQRAQSLGIKIIWSMNDITFRNDGDLRKRFRSLAATCSCTDNVGFITYVVNLVKNLPATYGYYIGDEVDPREKATPGIHWLSNLVKSLDPEHPRITVGASSNSPSQIYYYYPASMNETADFIGADYYPYGYITTGNDINTQVSKVAENLLSIANQYHKQYFMVLQAFAWEHLCNPWPSCAPFPSYAQMRAQRDLVLQNSHPRFILWYSYFELLKSDNPNKHWADLVAAAGADSKPSTPFFP